MPNPETLRDISPSTFTRPMPAQVISSMQHGMPYVTRPHLTLLLDSFFGAENWTSEDGQCDVADMRQVETGPPDNRKMSWEAAAWATASITIHGKQGPIRRAALGADNAYHQDPGMAIANAMRMAGTNAFKRAAAAFGPFLGSELAELTFQEAVARAQKWDEANQ